MFSGRVRRSLRAYVYAAMRSELLAARTILHWLLHKVCFKMYAYITRIVSMILIVNFGTFGLS